MDEIWTVLEGVTYPVGKADLRRRAQSAGAREDLMVRLDLLPERTFENAQELGRSLARTRAASNPALVAITVEVCEECGFPMTPGEPHSCIEEKARFAESANMMTDEFETLDEQREQ